MRIGLLKPYAGGINPAKLSAKPDSATAKLASQLENRDMNKASERREGAPAARITAPLHELLRSFSGLSLYERFEHSIVLILTLLIIGVVGSATWHLTQVVGLLILTNEVHPANQAVFQTVFGMIFTVIIALEFKHSLLIVLARQESIVRVRSIILIAMLAMVRKFIILDLGETASNELIALSAAILALGIVYWLVREEDRRRD